MCHRVASAVASVRDQPVALALCLISVTMKNYRILRDFSIAPSAQSRGLTRFRAQSDFSLLVSK